MLGDVSIRTATEVDVHRFVRDRDDRYVFLDHLAHKRGVLLFAFRNGLFVGHIFLRLDPPEEQELRDGLPGVPLLERLRVLGDHQRSGIGRQLIREAEEQLLAIGYEHVALGVHPKNVDAIRLYERLLFTVWREQDLTTFGVRVGNDGSTTREEEPCRIFVKRLTSRPA